MSLVALVSFSRVLVMFYISLQFAAEFKLCVNLPYCNTLFQCLLLLISVTDNNVDGETFLNLNRCDLLDLYKFDFKTVLLVWIGPARRYGIFRDVRTNTVSGNLQILATKLLQELDR